jgi:valyl-tRNA synthetase
MATETQDVRMPVKKLPDGRNTSEKFDFGRNFCNKLWNAARFAISNLEAISRSPACTCGVSLADRWILSRLAQAVTEVNAALDAYRFDAYAKLCYDFFWRDFCDWYVEAIKPTLKDPARAGASAQVMAAALDASLRLMHPVIPFITETIWWKLNEARPDRQIPGKYMAAASHRLITAPWPDVPPSLHDDQAERDFALLQEIIGAIRNLRNEYKVDARKSVDVHILCDDAMARLIQSECEIVELLATCKIKTSGPTVQRTAQAVSVEVAGATVLVDNVFDQAAEDQRIAKRRDELSRNITALRGRLSNQSYLAKAPPQLVQQTKDQLAAAEAEFAKIEK